MVPGAGLTAAPASQVLPTDELAEPKKSHRQSHRKKVLPEIYLTRLLSTKVGLASSPHQLRPCQGVGGSSSSVGLDELPMQEAQGFALLLRRGLLTAVKGA